MNERGFANIILVAVVAVIIGVGGYFTFVKKSEPVEQQSAPATTQTNTFDTVPTPKNETAMPTSTPTIEKASGIIKSVYSKSGKNYIDIDYVEFNPNWAPGGMSGVSIYSNSNPKIRTFEISPNVKILVNNSDDPSISFFEFQKVFMNDDSSNYQKINPWDIVIVDGVVVELREHFVS